MRFITARLGLAALFSTRILAHPSSSTAARSALQGRAIDLSAFRLKVEGQYSNAEKTSDIELPASFNSLDYTETATSLVKTVFPEAEFRLVPDHYIGSNSIGHVVFRQTIHGLDVDNADFNVNVAQDGSIFSYGNSFYTGPIPSENPLGKRDQVDPVEALKGASSALALPIVANSAATFEPEVQEAAETYVIKGASGTLKEPKAKLVYLQNSDSTLSLVWRLETDISDNWLLSYVDATNPKKVVGVVDYVTDASYTVFPWTVNDPTKGSRQLEVDPQNTVASEFTWQRVGSTTYSTTRGNNGIAQENYNGDSTYTNDFRPDAPGLNFTFPLDLTATDPKTYINASVTQLWYTANVYHDLLYLLGFTEVAGNFETDNNGQGGQGNDAVILNAQDGSGTNNANFATPVDGQAPRMRMYIWTYSTPRRDCSFDAGVVVHEYTHGLTNRLTGGPANSGCLSVTEAGGMGEGWSDFYAIAIHIKTTDTRSTNYPMGSWVYNNLNGIRSYVYSTSLTTNPLTYASANGQTAVHYIGTIWASILYEVLWNLIEKHGITGNRFPVFSNGVPTDGRFLALQLVTDGLSLQPCSPTFINARDAIIDADKARTGGANACALWTGFAKRGLGQGATRGSGNSGRTQSFVIPSGVC